MFCGSRVIFVNNLCKCDAECSVFNSNALTDFEISFNLATINSSSYVEIFLAFWYGLREI